MIENSESLEWAERATALEAELEAAREFARFYRSAYETLEEGNEQTAKHCTALTDKLCAVEAERDKLATRMAELIEKLRAAEERVALLEARLAFYTGPKIDYEQR